MVDKSVAKDKIRWIDEITKEEQDCKEQWGWIRHIASDYKPKRYARKNRLGETVNMDQRAEATKEYLAKTTGDTSLNSPTKKRHDIRAKPRQKS